MSMRDPNPDGCHHAYRVWQCNDGKIHITFKEISFQLNRKEFLHLAALCYQGWEQLCSKCPVRYALPCSTNYCLSECQHEPQTLHLSFGNLTVYLSRLEFSLLVKLCLRGESMLDHPRYLC